MGARSGLWGYVLLVLGITALAAAAVAAAFGERPELWYFLGLGAVSSCLGVAWIRWGHIPALSPREALAFVAASYLLFSLLGAIPFLDKGTFLDGWFEAVSGITTTGLSVFIPEQLPRSLVFFRSLYQWIGGAGIVVISLAFLLPPSRAALLLYSAEYGKENILGNARLMARRVATVYLGLTAAGYGAYVLAGMGPFDGLVHALSTISTGGFSPFSDSIGHYRSAWVEGVVSLFMICGATSFPLFWFLFRPKGWREVIAERELWFLLVVPLVLGAMIAAGIGSFGVGLFQGVSAVTTTGFATTPTSSLPDHARWALILGMVTGGMGGSTAGGLKLYRLLGIAALLAWTLRRAWLPGSAQVPFKILGRSLPIEEVTELAAYALFYLAVLGIATSVLVAMGYSLSDSLFEAASAQGTVGLSVGLAKPGAPVGTKLVLMLLMWMGRLEILPIILFLRKAVRMR